MGNLNIGPSVGLLSYEFSTLKGIRKAVLLGSNFPRGFELPKGGKIIYECFINLNLPEYRYTYILGQINARAVCNYSQFNAVGASYRVLIEANDLNAFYQAFNVTRHNVEDFIIELRKKKLTIWARIKRYIEFARLKRF